MKVSNKDWTSQLQRTKIKFLLGIQFKKEDDRKQGSFVGSKASRRRLCVDTLPLLPPSQSGAVPKGEIADAPGRCVLSSPTGFTSEVVAGHRELTLACSC